MAWTEEKVTLATSLWLEGFSATYIAQQLGNGFSRNSVIGKIHRLGLKKTDSARPQKAPEKPRTPMTRSKNLFLMRPAGRLLPPERVHTPRPIPVAPSLELTILQLTERTCRFITKPAGYCGHPVKDGTSYCEGHCEIVYMPPQGRKSA